jgi:hypothetical protein
MHLGRLFAVAILFAAVAPACATETTEWISTDAAEKTAAEMREKKMRLVALDCRSDPAAAAAVFSMVWEKNDDSRQWSWREAGVLDMKALLRDFRNKGFDLVSQKSYVSAAGTERVCALWHR